MKKSGKIIIALILAAAIALTAGIVVKKTVSSPKRQIKATITEVTEAYNAADIERMVKCFEPSVQTLYSGANSLLGSITGVDISTLSSLLPFASYLDEDAADISELPKLEITINNIDVTSDSTAVAYCAVKFGNLDPENSAMNMVKVDGNWYLVVDSLF